MNQYTLSVSAALAAACLCVSGCSPSETETPAEPTNNAAVTPPTQPMAEIRRAPAVPDPAPEEEPEGTESLVGKLAPEFALTTLAAQTAKLSDQKGNVVVLDFWATWCGPCIQSLPHIQELSANSDLQEKGVRVFTINVREKAETIQAFMDENKYTFNVLLDAEGTALKDYLVGGIPTTVIIDRAGLVREVFSGFGPDTAERMDRAIKSAITSS